MFDSLVTATAGTSGASSVCAWTRVESAACARRVFGMVDLLDAYSAAHGAAARDQWCLDNWGAVTAHLGAALTITSGTASRYLMVGKALRDRFPKIAAMFLAGQITYAMVAAIVTRTNLAIDPATFAELDALLAEQIGGWAPMSVDKTDKTIDALLEGLDPQAVHRTQAKARSRGVDLRRNTGSGIAELFITLFAHDAEAFYQKVTAMAATVCPADPRGVDQRRADATGALALGADRLACLCDTKDCPAPTLPAASSVVVYVVARHDTLTDPAPPPPAPEPDAPQPDALEPTDGAGEDSDGLAEALETEDEADPSTGDLTPTSDESGDTNRDRPVWEELRPNPAHPTAQSDADTEDSGDPTETATIDPAAECAGLDGTAPPLPKPLREMTLAEALAPEPGVLSQLAPGYIMAGVVLPGAVSHRAALNATLVSILHPGQAPPEARYTPSKKLADFVRSRDLTCRFPGCRHPATSSDVDHTIPYPYGPTCASNLKCLCRLHHLLKTFWGGPNGWRDRQLPDGTVEWTAPDGGIHITSPGSRLLFPELSQPTAPVQVCGAPPPAHTSGLTMPKRRRTRTEDRRRRVMDERDLNAELIDEQAQAHAKAKTHAAEGQNREDHQRQAAADATADLDPPPF